MQKFLDINLKQCINPNMQTIVKNIKNQLPQDAVTREGRRSTMDLHRLGVFSLEVMYAIIKKT